MQHTKLLEIIASHNRFWTTGDIQSGIRRDLLTICLNQLDSKEVMVLKGVRRSGKSTLMDQIIGHLLQRGVNPTRVLRVNLEEPLFSPEYSVELLELIYRTYRERIQPEDKCWLFLDEIQNIQGWEKWVRSRSETEEIKICITGSSSQVLSREIGTKLTGRHLSLEVYPLSFSEFLRFNNLTVKNELEYINNKSLIRHHFINYMQYGGFPEVVLTQDPENKKLLLKAYFEDILYRDVATRHEIRDAANLRNLAVYLLTNTSRQTSINKLKKNFTISQDKTENYVSALLESYLIFQLTKFSFSLKSTMRAGFKPYAIDTGLRNRVAFSFSEDAGHLVENIIFCHLRRLHEEVYFLANGHEADFAVKEGMHITRIIQVWHENAGTKSIPERETAFFKGMGDAHPQAEAVIITNEYEGDISSSGLKAHVIPATRFLLEDSHNRS